MAEQKEVKKKGSSFMWYIIIAQAIVIVIFLFSPSYKNTNAYVLLAAVAFFALIGFLIWLWLQNRKNTDAFDDNDMICDVAAKKVGLYLDPGKFDGERLTDDKAIYQHKGQGKTFMFDPIKKIVTGQRRKNVNEKIAEIEKSKIWDNVEAKKKSDQMYADFARSQGMEIDVGESKEGEK